MHLGNTLKGQFRLCLRRSEGLHIVAWLLGSAELIVPGVANGCTAYRDDTDRPQGILGQSPGHRTTLNIGLQGRAAFPFPSTTSLAATLILNSSFPRSPLASPLLSFTPPSTRHFYPLHDTPFSFFTSIEYSSITYLPFH